MGFGLTPEQREAIENEGGRLLVSAAAGSGKTRVLVERLLRKVDGGEDIDRFLVITFTNAAASELRTRIMDAIFERIAAEPANLGLRRQAGLLGRAHIETIHGFCGSVLREYAHRLRLPPDFRIADEKEASNLKETALNDLLDELYGSEDPEFEALAGIMGAGRDDSVLVRVILDTHEKLLSHPSPEKWVREQLSALELADVRDAGETVWGRSLMEETRRDAKWWLGTLRDILASCGDDAKFMRGYGKSIAATAQGLRELCEALDAGWDATREALGRVEFPRASAAPGFEREIGLRNACKDWVKKLSDIYWDDSAKALGDMRAMAPVMRSLLETVLRFDRCFADLKRKRGVLDFSDQEHLTLKLLIDPDTGELTQAAKDLSGRFAEIMVDEYQDVNQIQETIFNAVSRGGRNIFTVGDVKQSIYRFRLADPTIFLRHYDAFADAGSAGEGEPRKVVLSRNFRSKPKILEGVNFLFENIMSRELGDLDYGPRERLYAPDGAEDGPEPRVELDLVSVKTPSEIGKGRKPAGKEPNDAEAEDSPGRVEAEAMAAVRRIRELAGTMPVSDGAGGERPLAYGDIAVLLRSPRNVQAEWQRVFAREGVPLLSSQPVDFFSEYEVSLALSMLSVIDNPRQDIPLITVLRCPVYGFTAEDLAEIRLQDKSGDFYSALCKAAETDERCSDFMADLEELRTLAPDCTADELLWALYRKTGLFAVVSAMPSGQERRENLMLLLEQARSCEGAGIRGLFGFMTWVRRLRARGDGPETVGGGAENAVTLMSTHKSKGLEFPVVILGGLTHQFNNEDAGSRLLIHPELGPGPRLVDRERKIEYNTIARRAVARRLRREALSEEMRILYVAMTRPKERLILLCTYKDAAKAAEKLGGMDLPVPAQLLSSMSCAGDWVLSAALGRPESEAIRFGLDRPARAVSGSPWDMRLVTPELLRGTEGPAAEEEPEAPEPAAVSEELRARLEYVYPHRAASAMPSKVTATELKGTDSTDAAAEEAADLFPEPEEGLPIEAPERPAFMGGASGLTPAERGTAVHMVMQFADYARCRTVQGVKEEIDRLVRMNILSREQGAAVRPEFIARFFRTLPGQLMLGAEKLHRELKFSLLVDSDKIPGFAPGEKVLLQGVVDCCAETGGKLTVIDFKTDYVTDETIAEKTAYYAGQLDAYALAMERVLQKPVERRILCYLTAGKFKEI